MFRVGFILGSIGWTGGENYYRNLFTAIHISPTCKVKPIAFLGMKTDASKFEQLAEVVRSPMFDRYSFMWWRGKLLQRYWKDYYLYRLLDANGICLLSHVGGLWKGCAIPSLEWIPDFQHLHFREYFGKKECDYRDAFYNRIVNRGSSVLLSSASARGDFKFYCAEPSYPTYILRFVSCIGLDEGNLLSSNELSLKYKIEKPWFYLPNQFWEHKNHITVVESLKLMKQSGHCPLVVATGDSDSFKNKDYFPSLMDCVSEYGLQSSFKVLGKIPYSDVAGLMRHSVAVINPSLFEGWSTTVEEAKSSGKTIVLSDIEVHKEQNPEHVFYFSSENPNDLAEKMQLALDEYDEKIDSLNQNIARKRQRERCEDFAQSYEDIVIGVLKQSAAL